MEHVNIQKTSININSQHVDVLPAPTCRVLQKQGICSAPL